MTAERRVICYTVEVDGKPHFYQVSGPPLRAEAFLVGLAGAVVMFWAERRKGSGFNRCFRVFETDEAIPENARWVATTGRAVAADLRVWHLYELPFRETWDTVYGTKR